MKHLWEARDVVGGRLVGSTPPRDGKEVLWVIGTANHGDARGEVFSLVSLQDGHIDPPMGLQAPDMAEYLTKRHEAYPIEVKL